MGILVALGGASDIVETGLRSILATDGQIVVMDRYPDFAMVPDVVVYDAIAVEHDDGAELRALIQEQDSAFVVIGRDLRPDLAVRAVACGADGVISIETKVEEILDTIRRAAQGDLDLSDTVPGNAAGLSDRELDVLALIARGLSNHEIAEDLHLSVNTIKTYVRYAYRKIDVTTRSQAVRWCAQHGFEL